MWVVCSYVGLKSDEEIDFIFKKHQSIRNNFQLLLSAKSDIVNFWQEGSFKVTPSKYKWDVLYWNERITGERTQTKNHHSTSHMIL